MYTSKADKISQLTCSLLSPERRYCFPAARAPAQLLQVGMRIGLDSQLRVQALKLKLTSFGNKDLRCERIRTFVGQERSNILRTQCVLTSD